MPNESLRSCFLVALIVMATYTSPVFGDAFVVTRAMKATTVAEIFVEPESIRVEMEIGMADLPAFRNLLPDEVYERLNLPPRPWTERLADFFAHDLIIRPGDAGPLTGRIVKMNARRRIVRDEITGEPLAVQPKDAPAVIFAHLSYPFDGQPAALALRPPMNESGKFATANIGFVLYHEGVAVNDFRYLGEEEEVDLDWDDPWYSQFVNRNLRRQFAAPLAGFLYVDSMEVRKEIIARPRDLQHWLDLGLKGATTIPVADQGVVKDKVAAFLEDRCVVTIDGQVVPPVLDRIHFIRRTLRSTGVVDPPEDLPLVSATLGIIFRYPVKALPEEVTVDWDLFSDRIASVPAMATDEAGGLPSKLTPEDPKLVWKNFLTSPTSRELAAIAPPPGPWRLPVPMLSVLCVIVLLIAAAPLVRGRGLTPRRWTAVFVMLIGAAVFWPIVRVPVPLPLSSSSDIASVDTDAVVAGLLGNVYHAFDYREESDIYDALEQSTSGDLLTQVYLDMRRALELENQGGARARVSWVDVVASEITPLDEEAGFSTTCTWDVSGSVGHWGHIHERRNRYMAVLSVQPVDGVWKITSLQLLSEQRL